MDVQWLGRSCQRTAGFLARSFLGQLAAALSIQIGGIRPSDVLGFEGSEFERLMLDAEAIVEVLPAGESSSLSGDILAHRKALARRIGGYVI